MKAETSPFERFDSQDVADLIAEYPLAWVNPVSGRATPSLLPLLLERDADGRPSTLLGHMARWNPLLPALQAQPDALILFTGPQAYIPTDLVSDPHWAPTWNYAQLRVRARVAFSEDGAPEAIERLSAALGESERGWQPRDVGPRYANMVRAIIAFRAEIIRVEGRFKLGQDETPERLAEILRGHGDAALVRWMRRFNRGRTA